MSIHLALRISGGRHLFIRAVVMSELSGWGRVTKFRVVWISRVTHFTVSIPILLSRFNFVIPEFLPGRLSLTEIQATCPYEKY